MKTIGITGGVGAGKSLILDYMQNHYRVKVYQADEIANFLEEPGQSCYQPVIELLGKKILDTDQKINKKKMAEIIFAREDLLRQVNAIVHPAVKTFVLSAIETERQEGVYDFFVLEAALLIEEHYDEILDELWYIRSEERIRMERLKQSRGYSDERIRGIMQSQLSDETFMQHCQVIIENNHDPEATYRQIDEELGGYIGAEIK